MQVTVVVKVEDALSFAKKDKRTQGLNEVMEAAGALGVACRPLFPGVDDPSLATFFEVDVPDLQRGKQVIETFSHLEAVEGAYLKPADEPAK